MAWLYRLFARLFEVAWGIGLKYTEGFSRLVPSLLTVVAMMLSLALLGLALKSLPVGTAYAVWTGIGAVGTAARGAATGAIFGAIGGNAGRGQPARQCAAHRAGPDNAHLGSQALTHGGTHRNTVARRPHRRQAVRIPLLLSSGSRL